MIDQFTVEFPDMVFNCAGITGIPNVDWCESHIYETFDCNLQGMITMMNICRNFNVPLIHFSSGCIYDSLCEKYKDHKFTEMDIPNFTGSVYSLSRYLLEFFVNDDHKNYNSKLSILDNTLILRIRMPIVDELHPKNLITKILNYHNLIDHQNSISYLPELIPISLELAFGGYRGIYNFTNPGSVTHPWIVSEYNNMKNVKNDFEIISVETQNKFLKSKRSTCVLDTEKLEIALREINDRRLIDGKSKLILSDAKTAIMKSLKNIVQ